MNLLLIGFGPHTKKVYWNFLEKYKEEYSIDFSVLVELEDQREAVENFFSDGIHNNRFNEVLYFPNSERNTFVLSKNQEQELERVLHAYDIDSVIISTEPKAHLQYLQWSIKNNLNILIDKPIFALTNLVGNPRVSKRYFKIFQSLLTQYWQSNSICNVMCQRRFHPGYDYVRNELTKVVTEYNVPITYIDLFHSDGMWNMPNEFLSRENHPYKYGYGKLMHSGYHFIDLLASLRAINSFVVNKQVKSELTAKSYYPKDFLHSFSSNFYEKVFHKRINLEQKLNKFGELDVNFIMQDKIDSNVITTIMVSLLQNSFSRRAWFPLPSDTYKSNGRVRHERLNIEVGPLMNIQVHSYQADPKMNKGTKVGETDHFEIYIFRNSEIIGGKPVEIIDIGSTITALNEKNDKYLGQNEYAREICFKDFLNYSKGGSDLTTHQEVNFLISKLYESLSNMTGTTKFSYKPLV